MRVHHLKAEFGAGPLQHHEITRAHAKAKVVAHYQKLHAFATSTSSIKVRAGKFANFRLNSITMYINTLRAQGQMFLTKIG